MSQGIPRPIKILLVDDDKTFNQAVELRVSRAGFQTETANDGPTALKLFQSKSFDLVILDLVMPGMPGFEVLEAMHNARPNVPIAVLSLLHQEEDIEKVTKLGATKYFSKSDGTFLEKLIKYAEEVSTS